MLKTSSWAIVAALLGSVSCSDRADEQWDNTLASCQDFASKFSNTCTTATAFRDLPAVSVTCTNNYGQCAGTVGRDGECTWDRKLCVTCRDDRGTIKIRVQTNGLPEFCYTSPRDTPTSQIVDYEVNWMTTATRNPASSPTD